MRVYPMGGTDYYPYVYLGAMPYPAQQGDDFEPCGKYFAGQTQEHTVTTFLDLIDVATGESVSGYPQRVAPNWSVSIVDGGYMKIVSWTVKANGAVSVTTERYNPTYTKPLQDTKDSTAVTGGKLDAYVDASYYIDGGAGESVLLQSLTATANGTYTAPARTAYDEVNVNVTDAVYLKGLIDGTATSIVIPDTVTSIKPYTFYECSALESIIMPNSVTSIGNYAFYKCSALKDVSIPNSVTSMGDYVFDSCRLLETATIGNSVTRIGTHAFYDCVSLQSVTIGNSVTSIGGQAFFGCEALESVTIPASATSIDYGAFQFCSLKAITIPASVTSIGAWAFGNNDALQTITINKAEGSISGAPWGATNATVVWTG